MEVEVSTILRDVMDSWNSKTFEQQLSDLGRRFADLVILNQTRSYLTTKVTVNPPPPPPPPKKHKTNKHKTIGP